MLYLLGICISLENVTPRPKRMSLLSHTNGEPVEISEEALARRQKADIEARAKRNAKAVRHRERYKRQKAYGAGTYGGGMKWA